MVNGHRFFNKQTLWELTKFQRVLFRKKMNNGRTILDCSWTISINWMIKQIFSLKVFLKLDRQLMFIIVKTLFFPMTPVNRKLEKLGF